MILKTGIFAWVSANASFEEEIAGNNDITSYWRTLKSKGEINDKYPGGIKKQKELLEKEGHKIVQKGKKYYVINFEKKIFSDQ